MIERTLTARLIEALGYSPAVALLGPRQVGKTTLALDIAKGYDALYIDLESEQDRAKLAQAELYLADHADKLIIFDEIQRAPGLFPILRGQIDQGIREGRGAGRYLLLGSASLDLLKQSGESLAGRISYLELAPFSWLEVAPNRRDDLWVRGGFPNSMLAPDDTHSLRWRRDFIRTYLERDIPQFGPRLAAETLRRFWTMLAHNQGALLNNAQLSRSLGVDVKTVVHYLDLLVDLLLVRRLPPWHTNQGKRLVKSPKVYVRDSGLVHALLGIADKETLLSHPVAGASWECCVVENLLGILPPTMQGYFYRTAGGAEIDLVVAQSDGGLWAIEVKRSLSPKLERGFHAACDDLSPVRKMVIYPGAERYRLATDVEVMPLAELMQEVYALGTST